MLLGLMPEPPHAGQLDVAGNTMDLKPGGKAPTGDTFA